MISQEDYEVIIAVEMPGQNRGALLHSHRLQVARTFMNLLGHISKDQTIQYILILVDDILSVSEVILMRILETIDLLLFLFVLHACVS